MIGWATEWLWWVMGEINETNIMCGAVPIAYRSKAQMPALNAEGQPILLLLLLCVSACVCVCVVHMSYLFMVPPQMYFYYRRCIE